MIHRRNRQRIVDKVENFFYLLRLYHKCSDCGQCVKTWNYRLLGKPTKCRVCTHRYIHCLLDRLADAIGVWGDEKI